MGMFKCSIPMRRGAPTKPITLPKKDWPCMLKFLKRTNKLADLILLHDYKTSTNIKT